MATDVLPLTEQTWDLFADLVRRHGGIYGGCWCIAFHPKGERAGDNESAKHALVRAGRAHAALVVEGDACVGWAQYGPTDALELRHRREYDKAPPPVADWRITCVFVDRDHRGEGVARRALEGAVALIARAGGGRVEVISEVTDGRVAQSRFLVSGTVELLEDLGFERGRQVGKHAYLLGREVAPA